MEKLREIVAAAGPGLCMVRGTMISAFLVIAGIVALYFGAEWLVRGSSSLALRLGLPPLLVGLTVVACGTSSPELVVSTMAALGGEGDLAVGNVAGSNILNIGLILGLTALISPLRIDSQLLKWDKPIMIGSAALLFWLLRDYRIERGEALLLVVLAIGYVCLSIHLARRSRPGETGDAPAPEVLAAAAPLSRGRIALLIVSGLVFLVAGSRAFVLGASDIARMWGVSEALIGLTIVSLGTSLPELASSLIAAMRKEADIAVGNIVGSNIFNTLGIAGVAGLISPIHAPGILSSDLAVMLGFSVLLLVMAWTGSRLRRAEGAVLLLCYAGYVAWLWPA